jgi:hypothetical protein
MRTLIERPSVSETIEINAAQYPRLIQAYEGLRWLLSRQPESGELLDAHHWIIKQPGVSEIKVPAITAIYRFDHTTVEIIAVLVSMPPV